MPAETHFGAVPCFPDMAPHVFLLSMHPRPRTDSDAAAMNAVLDDDDDDVDALMARLANGDRSVFSPLFRRLWAPTHRFCMSLLGNEADASDAAQEAMAKILERAATYDAKRSAMPWAFAIAAWECKTLQRKRSRRRESPEQGAPESVGPSAEEDIIRRGLIHAAVAALGQLSESDQSVLLTTFWEEAAAVSGATFRKRRERATERLRNAWRKLYGIG
jgi:RNA polymerase sigma-70 factor (ECF subfamily)